MYIKIDMYNDIYRFINIYSLMSLVYVSVSKAGLLPSNTAFSKSYSL